MAARNAPGERRILTAGPNKVVEQQLSEIARRHRSPLNFQPSAARQTSTTEGSTALNAAAERSSLRPPYFIEAETMLEIEGLELTFVIWSIGQLGKGAGP